MLVVCSSQASCAYSVVYCLNGRCPIGYSVRCVQVVYSVGEIGRWAALRKIIQCFRYYDPWKWKVSCMRDRPLAAIDFFILGFYNYYFSVLA